MRIEQNVVNGAGENPGYRPVSTQTLPERQFAGLIQEKSQALKFSSHAMTRMKSRNIGITPQMIDKLDKAVSGAQKKGARDTLVLLSDLAFIVNIPNKTVVTAMEGRNMKDHIVTNIDSTVIAD
jgi:flagellar operon protein